MKKNIVMFVPDQMRRDSLHHQGNQASITPNFDELANEGVSFENAYCQNPVCVPSRSSFLSGLYPHTNGHRTMHYLPREEEPNILREMKNNGYEVIWIGRNDVIPSDRLKTDYCDEYYDGVDMENKRDVYGEAFSAKKEMTQEHPEVYERMLEGDNYYSFYMGKLPDGNGFGKADWNCIQSVLDYIDRKTQEDNEKPFFIYCSILFPHPPYACEEPWYSSIDRNKLDKRRTDVKELINKPSMLYEINRKQNLGSWTEERFNELRATYLAMVSRVDYQFGLIIDKLKEKEIYDDTSVIVFSDHGDYTGDYGIVEKTQNTFEDPVSNVPFLIKPAKGIPIKQRITKAQIELLDVPATLADLAGFELEYTHFGKSILDVVAGEETHKETVYCEGGRIHGETQAMELGHGKESIYWPRLSTQYSEGAEHTKALMCKTEKYKYILRLYETDELYDLEKDPLELDNVINNKDYKEVVSEMKNKALHFYMETTDFVPNKRDPR